MTSLYLHVGHSKTGTTWLQAVLSLSRGALAAHGLAYPCDGAARAPESAEIGLGNAPRLAVSEDRLRAELAGSAATHSGRGVVYSSEELFPQLLALPRPQALAAISRDAGFENVRILLFARDPMAHATSLWQQYLKRGGGTAPVEAFFARYSVPERVAEFLERFGAVPGITVQARNYSRWQDRLLDPLAHWLGMPTDAFTTPVAGRLNRSMTRAELAMQRALNHHLGKRGCILSDAVCERLPGIAPDDLRPELAVQEAAWRRLQPAIGRAHDLLPEQEHYRYDCRAPEPSPEHHVLSEMQIEVIADALGAEIAWLRAQLAVVPTQS